MPPEVFVVGIATFRASALGRTFFDELLWARLLCTLRRHRTLVREMRGETLGRVRNADNPAGRGCSRAVNGKAED